MRWFVAVIFSICLLLGVFLLLVDFGPMYHLLYRVSGVYEEFPWTTQEIEQVTQHMRDYVLGRSDDLFVVIRGELVFRAQEIFHMWEVRCIFHDVRRIFVGLLIVLIIGLMLTPARLIFRRQLYSTLGLFGLLGVAAAIFEKSFLWMHLLLFDNLYWGFTYDHRLIQLLKEEFFLGFLLATIVLTLLLSFIIYLFGSKGDRHAAHL